MKFYFVQLLVLQVYFAAYIESFRGIVASHDFRSQIAKNLQEALKAHKEGLLDCALEKYRCVLDGNCKVECLNKNQLSRIHLNAGGIYFQQSKVLDATEHFEAALHHDPGLAEAHLNLAIVLSEDRTKLTLAERHALLTLQGDNDRLHTKAHTLLSNIYSDLGRSDLANKHILLAQKAGSASIVTSQSTTAGTAWPSPAWTVVPRSLHLNDGRLLVPERLAHRPPIFRIPNFLSPAECRALIDAARGLLRPSSTFADDTAAAYNISVSDCEISSGLRGRTAGGLWRRSSTAWLPLLGEGPSRVVAARVAEVLGLPPQALHASERMQVVRYEAGGRFDLHHDATGFLARRATALIYLSDVPAGAGGETEFPRAVPAAAEDQGGGGGEGLRVSPREGDCIVFDNLEEEMGTAGGVSGRRVADERAVHRGAEVRAGEKWVANVWIAAGP